jgi:hypothetical protein
MQGNNHSTGNEVLDAKKRLLEQREALHRRAEFTMSLPKIEDSGPIAGPSSITEKVSSRTEE